MNPVIADALLSSLFISLIPMAAISLGGGVVALLQAITQVQEQSMVHFARIVALVVVLLWGGHEAYTQLETIFIRVIALAGSKVGG
jgi:type III secretory pathway component EscS